MSRGVTNKTRLDCATKFNWATCVSAFMSTAVGFVTHVDKKFLTFDAFETYKKRSFTCERYSPRYLITSGILN